MQKFNLLVLGEPAEYLDFFHNHLASVMAKEISADALEKASNITLMIDLDGKYIISDDIREVIYKGKHYGKPTIVCAHRGRLLPADIRKQFDYVVFLNGREAMVWFLQYTELMKTPDGEKTILDHRDRIFKTSKKGYLVYNSNTGAIFGEQL